MIAKMLTSYKGEHTYHLTELELGFSLSETNKYQKPSNQHSEAGQHLNTFPKIRNNFRKKQLT